MKDIYGADYTSLLRCPMDDRGSHPFGAAHPERKLCAHGAMAKCRLESFPTTYSGLFRGAPHCVVRLSTAVAPPTGAAAVFLGKMRKAKLFPCVAIKAFRGGGAAAGNLLFAGGKTGHPETDFFAHGVCARAARSSRGAGGVGSRSLGVGSLPAPRDVLSQARSSPKKSRRGRGPSSGPSRSAFAARIFL